MSKPAPFPGTHLGHTPDLHSSAWVAASAELIGAVSVGARSSIWYQCVLRGDIEAIEIGEESNLQDGTIVHMASDLGTYVGDRVSVGHGAILHACRLEDEVLVGMGAVVMDGAVIGEGSILGARTLVTKGEEIPPGSLVLGSPGKVLRGLTEEERTSIPKLAAKYVDLAAQHRERFASS